jgi:YbbR domain-containing protein
MKGLLSANVPEKIASVILALLLWQFVLRVEMPMTTRPFENVPVEYINQPEELVLTSRPTSIHVDARIIGADVTSIDKDQVTLVVDLKNAREGRNRLLVSANYATGGVMLTPRPKYVDVTLEPWRSKELSVRAMTTGAWDFYRPGPITVTPADVRISGPQSWLSQAAEARVIVNLSAIEPGAAAQALVQILKKDGTPLEVTVDPSSVTVRVKPVSLPPEKNVLIQPTWRGAPKFGYRVERYEMLPSQVRVKGSAELLSVLTSVDTNSIDLSDLDSTHIVNVKLKLPPGITADVEDVQVRIYISKEPPQAP